MHNSSTGTTWAEHTTCLPTTYKISGPHALGSLWLCHLHSPHINIKYCCIMHFWYGTQIISILCDLYDCSYKVTLIPPTYFQYLLPSSSLPTWYINKIHCKAECYLCPMTSSLSIKASCKAALEMWQEMNLDRTESSRARKSEGS